MARADTPEPAAQADRADEVGANVALGAKYTLWPAPNYIHCTDPDDLVYLTDRKTTTAYFWTQKSTVGWQSAKYAVITVDLGKVQPISGVSFNTAAGTAGVTWPAAIRILTSDDGKTYHNAGDLVALDRKAHGPMPEGYAIRRLATHELKTRGRYVRFVAIPPAGGPYLFVDEVEVFRGPDELLAEPAAGEPVGDVADLFIHWKSTGPIRAGVCRSCSGPARLLDPYTYYRLQAWHCWREGATGTFFWAFGDNSGASSWNEYLARSGPYTPLFLDDTGVAPAKQMEAVRESIQDYETLLLLERAVERAEQSGRDDAAVPTARQLLRSAAAEVLDADGASAIHWHDAKDRTFADAVRARVLEALTADNAWPNQ